MKFNSDSAKAKFNADMSKADLEQGYEIVPMQGNFAGDVANKRLGLTNPWSVVGCEMLPKQDQDTDD